MLLKDALGCKSFALKLTFRMDDAAFLRDLSGLIDLRATARKPLTVQVPVDGFFEGAFSDLFVNHHVVGFKSTIPASSIASQGFSGSIKDAMSVCSAIGIEFKLPGGLCGIDQPTANQHETFTLIIVSKEMTPNAEVIDNLFLPISHDRAIAA